MKASYEDNCPFFEKFLSWLRYMKIRKYIFKESKPVCVDIGCGFDGRFLRNISRHIKVGYGFDLRANEAKYGNVNIINNRRYDGRIPIKDYTADCVFMLAVLEHLPINTSLLDEAVRILKKADALL